jgi:hypothetical protein
VKCPFVQLGLDFGRFEGNSATPLNTMTTRRRGKRTKQTIDGRGEDYVYLGRTLTKASAGKDNNVETQHLEREGPTSERIFLIIVQQASETIEKGLKKRKKLGIKKESTRSID